MWVLPFTNLPPAACDFDWKYLERGNGREWLFGHFFEAWRRGGKVGLALTFPKMDASIAAVLSPHYRVNQRAVNSSFLSPPSLRINEVAVVPPLPCFVVCFESF